MCALNPRSRTGGNLSIVSIHVRQFKELTPEMISDLHSRLRNYYQHPPKSYYQISDQAATQYTASAQPFHCDLVNRIKSGTSVLELGCGSAHLCPFVEAAGGRYTGMDYSAELLKNNMARFPRARFLTIQTELDEKFDLVVSLYTIEHVVDPTSYLGRMLEFCRPGGLIAIICPDFVESPDFPPSFWYGRTARRCREKLATFSFVDALAHLVDLFWVARRWKKRARAADCGAFWINLKPRVFFELNYSIDVDAVHLPRLKDLVCWLGQHGGSIIATSQTLPDIDPNVLRYNCYVLARTPT